MKKCIECNFGDVIFYVNTFNEKDYLEQINHISKFYAKNRLPRKEVKEININYVTDNYEYIRFYNECKKIKGKLYQSFENEIHKEIKFENGQKIYMINNLEYVCLKENEQNYTIITNGDEKGIKYPFRIVREILVREREDLGQLFVHGTGITLNENGILLLGNSGSGKTTLAVNLLKDEIDKKGFISNDRVFLDKNDMNYFPIPIVFASGTVKNNMQLKKYFEERKVFEKSISKKLAETGDNDKVPIPLTDIEKIFNKTTLKNQCKVDTIIFPKIKFDMDDKYVFSEMTGREKYIKLDSICFTPFDSESLRLEWIRKRKKSIEEISEIKYDTFQAIIKDKRILKLEYGINSNKSKIVEEILR